MRRAAVAALVAALLPALPVHAADLDVSVSTHYSSGNYGGKGHVEIVYVPLVAKLDVGAWSFKTVVPYLRIGGGVTTTVDAMGGVVESRNGTSEGPGDVLLEGSYAVSPFLAGLPFVEVGARMKLPTARASRGLGTGRFDVIPEVQFTRRYGRWAPYASIGFRVLGDSADASYRDGFLATAGLSCRLGAWFEPGLFLDWRQSAAGGYDDAVELFPVLRFDWSEHWTMDAYASAGFTDSSPDAGGGIQFHYRMRDLF